MYIYIYIYEGVMVLWCLTPFSTTFQLYRRCQFYWRKKLKYPEKTTDLPEVTDKRYYTIITLVGVLPDSLSPRELTEGDLTVRGETNR
jgi:hypothetical protein